MKLKIDKLKTSCATLTAKPKGGELTYTFKESGKIGVLELVVVATTHCPFSRLIRIKVGKLNLLGEVFSDKNAGYNIEKRKTIQFENRNKGGVNIGIKFKKGDVFKFEQLSQTENKVKEINLLLTELNS